MMSILNFGLTRAVESIQFNLKVNLVSSERTESNFNILNYTIVFKM